MIYSVAESTNMKSNKFQFASAVALTLASVPVYGQWLAGYYIDADPNQPISAIPWSKYNEIDHFAALPQGDGTVLLGYLTQIHIKSFIASRPSNSGKKAIVVLKDNDSDYTAFGNATNSTNLSTFVTNIAA